jgi:DinB superfamily
MGLTSERQRPEALFLPLFPEKLPGGNFSSTGGHIGRGFAKRVLDRARLLGGQARYTSPRRTEMKLAKPEAGEYAAYYDKYVSIVSGDDIASVLKTQRVQTMQLLAGRSEREGNFRYAVDKWTVKEVLGHVNDAERIFTYRALRIARGDQTPLPGFEQDDYVRSAGSNERPLANLVEEFADIRSASLALFRSFGRDEWLRRGTASKNEVSVRALAFITAGHELHHRRILEERYFSAIPRA